MKREMHYFRGASDEFTCGVTFEEIWDDETTLLMFEGRLPGKVERINCVSGTCL